MLASTQISLLCHVAACAAFQLHAQSLPRPAFGAMHVKPLSMCVNPSSMSYRELQQACKANGLRAAGKAVELRERLERHFAGEAESAATAIADPAVSEAAGSPPGPSIPIDHRLDVVDTGLGAIDEELAALGLLDDTGPGPAGTTDTAHGTVPSDGADALEALLGEAADAVEAIEGAAPGFDAAGEVLFDELLSDLDSATDLPPGAFDAYGVYRPAASAESAADVSAEPSMPLDPQTSRALSSLDALETDSTAGSFAEQMASLTTEAAGGSEPLATETFDEAWLEELFGPINDGAKPGTATAGATSGGRGGGVGGGTAGGMGGAPRDDRRGGRRDGRSFNEARTLRSDDPNDGLRRSISRASLQADHAQVLQLFGKWRRRSAPVDEPV